MRSDSAFIVLRADDEDGFSFISTTFAAIIDTFFTEWPSVVAFDSANSASIATSTISVQRRYIPQRGGIPLYFPGTPTILHVRIVFDDPDQLYHPLHYHFQIIFPA